MQTSNHGVRQLNALRLYGALVGIREDWGGALVLCCGEGCAIGGISVAVSIAGGATLTIDSDAAALKSAMRAGDLDFVVNTLDEALRTLKNQVRQRRPLSVGLIGDLSLALSEMVERGVLPDLLAIETNQRERLGLEGESLRVLQAEGMAVLVMADPNRGWAGDPAGNGHDEFYLPAADAAALKEIDERVLAILPASEKARRRWILQAPRYLREARSGGRWVRLSDKEREQLGELGSTGQGEQPRP